MTQPPDIVDRHALTQRRKRARAPAMFLHEAAITEIKERLNEVNRSFTSPAVVTGFPDIWRDVVPKAHIVTDDDLLDLQPGAYDLILHGLALHWANDPVGQLVQCRRALRPDGLFLAVLFGGQTLHELRAALAQAEAEISGGLSPRVMQMAEIRDLGGLLQRAGFAQPVADLVPQSVTYQTLPHLMSDLRAMGETNAMSARLRNPSPRKLFDAAASHYAQNFPAADDRINATFEMIFLTGWSPDASQQKPLRPGSAAARLADALDTTEFDENADPKDKT